MQATEEKHLVSKGYVLTDSVPRWQSSIEAVDAMRGRLFRTLANDLHWIGAGEKIVIELEKNVDPNSPNLCYQLSVRPLAEVQQ
jgi:hypothetical protein